MLGNHRCPHHPHRHRSPRVRSLGARGHRNGAFAGCAAAVAVTALSLAALPGAAVAAPGGAALAEAGITGTPAADTGGTGASAADPIRTGLGHAQAAGDRTTVGLPDEALAALRRDLGLTSAQARTRIAHEQRAPRIAAALSNALGASYGGAWLSGKTANLNVATTDPDRRADITAAGARAVVVTHSLHELDTAKAALDRAAAHSSAPAAAHVWYVDVPTNWVVVQSAEPSRASEFVDSSRAGGSLVRVRESAEAPHPYADLRGGDAYYINDAARCSIGFPVTKDGTSRFVTAGHCGTAGDTTTGFNRLPQGVFQASRFPGHDYAWVAANDQWTARPWVSGPGGADVTVAGSRQALVGSSVCRSGSTSGWHCGTIQQHDTSVTYPQGTVVGVSRTTVCAEPGDSGGPFISGNQAQGVTSGGSGNCTTGGTTYYQPVNPILKAYGLTLATG